MKAKTEEALIKPTRVKKSDSPTSINETDITGSRFLQTG